MIFLCSAESNNYYVIIFYLSEVGILNFLFFNSDAAMQSLYLVSTLKMLLSCSKSKQAQHIFFLLVDRCHFPTFSPFRLEPSIRLVPILRVECNDWFHLSVESTTRTPPWLVPVLASVLFLHLVKTVDMVGQLCACCTLSRIEKQTFYSTRARTLFSPLDVSL